MTIARLAAAAASLILVILGAAASAVGQPTEADVYVQDAILDIDDRRYETALEKLALALRREPDHVEALYYAGVAHMAAGRPEQAVAFLERAWRISPETSVTYQLGLAYFGAKRTAEARPLLERAFAQDPTLDALGYYVGLLRYQAGDAQGALRAFRLGRTSDPNIAQLTKLYAGLALADLGLTAQAMAEIDQALRTQPASRLTGPTERLRETLVATRASQRRFHLSAALGIYFDDNAPAEPNARAGDPTVNTLRRNRRETTGEGFAVLADYDWLRLGDVTATVSAGIVATYNNELPSFNVQDFVLGTGLQRITTVAGMPLTLSVNYVFDYLRLDDRELVQRHAVQGSVALAERARHMTIALARVEVKEYAEVRPLPAEEFQDAVNWLVGLVHVLRFARDRHFVRAGYHFDVEDARGDNFAYVGHRLILGGQYTLPWRDIRLGYDFDVHFRDYQHKHTLLPAGREGSRARADVELTHSFRAELPLPRALSLAARVTAKNVESNIAVFDYARNFYELSLSWRY